MPRLSARRFRAMLIKEYRHVLRAPRTLALVVIAPAALLLLLAHIYAVEAEQARFALWDLDRSSLSRQYVNALTADRDFTLEDEVASYSVLVFRVPFRGSFLLYLVLTGLYMAAMIGLVMALAPALRSQQVAFFVVLVFFFVPSFFVSGLVTPVYREGLRRLSSDIFPATHYMIIARGIFVKGLEFGQLLRPTAFLSGMCVGGTLIALLSFRKRLM